MLEYTGKSHTFAICAYKESLYLEECIHSLQKQTVKSKIIMATSTPNEYIRKIAERYKIPLYIREGKSNIAKDWNFAYEQCNTELVTIAHQDDIYKPEYLKEALEKLNKAKNPIIYFNNYNEIREGVEVQKNQLLTIKRFMLIPLIPKLFQKSPFVRRRVLSMGCPILCPSVLYVTQRMPNPLFTSNMRASLDWEQWEKLSRLKGEFLYSTKILTCHRIHKDSETSAALGDSARIIEDYEMFCKFWPKWIAKIIKYFYAKSEKSNWE
ncbi:MAG: glycosyltransferase [Lachnospiraceae bacterium]|nr:glycosyltransferase [Lachnospiraceae bacterium]